MHFARGTQGIRPVCFCVCVCVHLSSSSSIRPCSDCQPKSIIWHIQIVTRLILWSLDSKKNPKKHMKCDFCKSDPSHIWSWLKCDSNRISTVRMLWLLKLDFSVSFLVTDNVTQWWRQNQSDGGASEQFEQKQTDDRLSDWTQSSQLQNINICAGGEKFNLSGSLWVTWKLVILSNWYHKAGSIKTEFSNLSMSSCETGGVLNYKPIKLQHQQNREYFIWWDATVIPTGKLGYTGNKLL